MMITFFCLYRFGSRSLQILIDDKPLANVQIEAFYSPSGIKLPQPALDEDGKLHLPWGLFQKNEAIEITYNGHSHVFVLEPNSKTVYREYSNSNQSFKESQIDYGLFKKKLSSMSFTNTSFSVNTKDGQIIAILVKGGPNFTIQYKSDIEEQDKKLKESLKKQ